MSYLIDIRPVEDDPGFFRLRVLQAQSARANYDRGDLDIEYLTVEETTVAPADVPWVVLDWSDKYGLPSAPVEEPEA